MMYGLSILRVNVYVRQHSSPLDLALYVQHFLHDYTKIDFWSLGPSRTKKKTKRNERTPQKKSHMFFFSKIRTRHLGPILTYVKKSGHQIIDRPQVWLGYVFFKHNRRFNYET